HPAGFLAAPAVLVAILVRRPTTLLNWNLLLTGLAALLIGLSAFIYEPIRAAHFPPINEGAPTACATHLELGCTFQRLTVSRLMANINREQYGEKLERGASYPAQIGMWWLYFKWQWLRDAHNAAPAVQL